MPQLHCASAQDCQHIDALKGVAFCALWIGYSHTIGLLKRQANSMTAFPKILKRTAMVVLGHYTSSTRLRVCSEQASRYSPSIDINGGVTVVVEFEGQQAHLILCIKAFLVRWLYGLSSSIV